HPLDWAEFRENLALIEERHEDFNIQFAAVHATAQVYNVLRLDELCEFVKGLRFINPYPQIALIVHPEVFDVRVLPPDLKEEAGRRLRAYTETIRHDAAATELRRQLNAVVEHMFEGDHSHLISGLRRYNEVFDRH